MGMEKRRPTYDLATFKKAFTDTSRLAISFKAMNDARNLGFDQQGPGHSAPVLFVHSTGTGYASFHRRAWAMRWTRHRPRLHLFARHKALPSTQSQPMNFPSPQVPQRGFIEARGLLR